MERTDPQYKLRLPRELKDRVQEAAKGNHRSMNAEIVARLQESFHIKAAMKNQIDDEFLEGVLGDLITLYQKKRREGSLDKAAKDSSTED